MKSKNKVLGIIMLILGVVFLLENLKLIQYNFIRVWPFLVILSGAGFWLGYLFNRRNLSMILPGTILLVYGSVFLYCQVFSWDSMVYLWPVFLIAPGIAFFLFYILGKREKGLLMPAIILTILGLLFIFRHIEYLMYWPVLLIIGGIIVIFLDDFRKPKAGKPETDNANRHKETD